MTGGLPPPGGSRQRRTGLLEPGNIDLSRRPVVMNDDGSFSTVRSMSFQDDNGNEVLIPTVSDDGRMLNENEAIDLYFLTGRHLGKFKTPRDADAYARRLHTQQEQMYGGALPRPGGH